MARSPVLGDSWRVRDAALEGLRQIACMYGEVPLPSYARKAGDPRVLDAEVPALTKAFQTWWDEVGARRGSR